MGLNGLIAICLSFSVILMGCSSQRALDYRDSTEIPSSPGLLHTFKSKSVAERPAKVEMQFECEELLEYLVDTENLHEFKQWQSLNNK